MIVVTGAAGFIGSSLVARLNKSGYNDIVLIDKFNNEEKNKNLEGKTFSKKVDRDVFFDWLKDNQRFVQFVFHIGARSDTTEKDKAVFDELNLGYSKEVWKLCVEFGLPLVYASSAATYGLGEYGYEDSHNVVQKLKPLNLYGHSKNDFDKWALAQERKPFFWAGMKFFNVYGPNEYHKGRMASVILHAYKQIMEKGSVKLFKSHHPNYKDGEQLRDFVYVKDVVAVLEFLMETRNQPGLYNLGTGKARTFYDLVKSTFVALGKEPVVEFIDTPVDIRDKYQYFTEAKMDKIRTVGYKDTFCSLEDGIKDYVQQYLVSNTYF